MYQLIFEQVQKVFNTLKNEQAPQPAKEVVSRAELAESKLVWQNPDNNKDEQDSARDDVDAAAHMKQQFAAQGLLRSDQTSFGKPVSEFITMPKIIDAPAAMLASFAANNAVHNITRPFGIDLVDFLK